MGTKEYILGRTVFLFNQQGESATSLRQIAAFAEMSNGNLRYHYKSKEELVLDLATWMLEDLDQAITASSKHDCTPEEVQNRFRAIFRIMYKYKFLFVESPLLRRKYKNFRKALSQLYNLRKKFTFQFIHEFKLKGIFSDRFDHHFYNSLVEQVYIISDSWLKYIEMEETAILELEAKIEHYIRLCFGVFRPVLTEKGIVMMEPVLGSLSLPAEANSHSSLEVLYN
jgi:AcrR family transcriptional regulator